MPATVPTRSFQFAPAPAHAAPGNAHAAPAAKPPSVFVFGGGTSASAAFTFGGSEVPATVPTRSFQFALTPAQPPAPLPVAGPPEAAGEAAAKAAEEAAPQATAAPLPNNCGKSTSPPPTPPAEDASAAELEPRTPAPPPVAPAVANWDAAEAWLIKAEARHDVGDDEAALRYCAKSLRLCESAQARQLEKRIRDFGAGSAPAKAAARVMRATDDYEVLEVGRSASEADVKRAYKRLALHLHPDRNHATEAEAAFKRLQAAYEKVKARVSAPQPCGGGSSASRSTRHESFCPRCQLYPLDESGDEQCEQCDADDDEEMMRSAARARASAQSRPQSGRHSGGRCSICQAPYTPPPSYMGHFPVCHACRDY